MSNSTAYDFHAVGRLPVPDDNVAIATRRLDAGTLVNHDGRRYHIDYTILEGHRFAIQLIAPDEALLSWGLPFGYAMGPIAPGSYVRNPKILKALATRGLDLPHMLRPIAASDELLRLMHYNPTIVASPDDTRFLIRIELDQLQ